MRPRHDDPDLPFDVQADELDRVARNELKTLTKDNAEWVAKHLVMAVRLIDEDPELAHRHVLSAARRAGRIAIVRETLAITAYATGDFALALRELRTFRRISGKDDQLPLMVDSERGVGRPDRALELGRSVDRSTLAPGVQVALAIAMSGARLDLGQTDAALGELEIAQLDPNTAFSYSPELFDAYGDVLEDLGRDEDAALWHGRAERAAEAIARRDGEDDEMIEVIEEDLGDDETLGQEQGIPLETTSDEHAEDVEDDAEHDVDAAPLDEADDIEPVEIDSADADSDDADSVDTAEDDESPSAVADETDADADRDDTERDAPQG
ncbi:hypothetical protein E6C70_07775 [Glaciibacter flavus]|uniref:Replicase polyprotein 1ab n=1 Tax=Orlajensenia flava TaxID=2565934 RepID=A0A4V3WU20_9MICO|nr:hypothetical protein [Glaciibacter flavus]THG34187.1 hypothetical protein E6C70_07775 [Glaciibacter flavus]